MDYCDMLLNLLAPTIKASTLDSRLVLFRPCYEYEYDCDELLRVRMIELRVFPKAVSYEVSLLNNLGLFVYVTSSGTNATKESHRK